VVNKRQRIGVVFSALADPTRQRIMESLYRRGESQVTILAKPFEISLPAFSRHLRVLEHARLIERRREGRLHLIRARAAGLKEAQGWLTHLAAGWESSFDSLDQLLKSELAKEKKS